MVARAQQARSSASVAAMPDANATACAPALQRGEALLSAVRVGLALREYS